MYKKILYSLLFNHLWDYLLRIRSIIACSLLKEHGKTIRFKSISLLVGPEYMCIGNNTRFGKSLYLAVWKDVKNNGLSSINKAVIQIGSNCSFGPYNNITAINGIKIGNNVLTGKWVTITDNSHGTTDIETLKIPPLERSVYSKGSIYIEDNVWIGDKVTILPNVHIGKGAVIAANAVVTKDVDAFTVVGGNPAKRIK